MLDLRPGPGARGAGRFLPESVERQHMAIHLQSSDVFRQTVQTLWAHKLRSFLTMFGITWGVMSLLLLGSVGEGFCIGQRVARDSCCPARSRRSPPLRIGDRLQVVGCR